METIVQILIGVIASIHIFFLIMQTFVWKVSFVQKRIVTELKPEAIVKILAKT